jgi:hypothetical protein
VLTTVVPSLPPQSRHDAEAARLGTAMRQGDSRPRPVVALP